MVVDRASVRVHQPVVILIFFEPITFLGTLGSGETDHPILDGPILGFGWLTRQFEYFRSIGIETQRIGQPCRSDIVQLVADQGFAHLFIVKRYR